MTPRRRSLLISSAVFSVVVIGVNLAVYLFRLPYIVALIALVVMSAAMRFIVPSKQPPQEPPR